MKVLRQRLGGAVRFEGVGGQSMAREGLASLFPIEELSIMGFSAVVKQLPKILRLIRQTAAAVTQAAPDILVIIDSPDFTHRVARRVRARDPSLPIVDYVSPRSGRGGRAGRARCWATSITSSPCCLSSRRRIAGFTVRRAVMSVIPWSNKSMCFVPMPTNNGAGTANRRFCWCCREAAAAKSSHHMAVFGETLGLLRPAVRSRPSHHAAFAGSGSGGREKLAGAAADHRRRTGKESGVPHRACGFRQIGHRDTGTGARRACRWSPPTGWEPSRPGSCAARSREVR